MKNDTKSSAGDKFETGREMMQMELNKHQAQLKLFLQLQQDLARLDVNKIQDTVIFGSLVMTTLGCYFFSVALGKISVDGCDYYALSLASPVGKRMQGARAGDVIPFQGKSIEITEII